MNFDTMSSGVSYPWFKSMEACFRLEIITAKAFSSDTMFFHIHIESTFKMRHRCPISDVFLCVCRRQRELKPGLSPYRALLDTLELSDSRITLQLINDNNKVTKYTKAELLTNNNNSLSVT